MENLRMYVDNYLKMKDLRKIVDSYLKDDGLDRDIVLLANQMDIEVSFAYTEKDFVACTSIDNKRKIIFLNKSRVNDGNLCRFILAYQLAEYVNIGSRFFYSFYEIDKMDEEIYSLAKNIFERSNMYKKEKASKKYGLFRKQIIVGYSWRGMTVINVVGTMFFDNNKLLLCKPRKNPTYQLIAGKIELGELPLEAAIRECHEELGDKIFFYKSNFEFLMEFDEIASSDNITTIHFYLFKYTGELKGKMKISEEIESFLWYDSSYGTDILSNTLRNEVVPYCLSKKLIKQIEIYLFFL